MRNVKNHTRVSVVRTKFRKSINGTCSLYSPLQKRFAEFLDKDNNVKEFEANVVVSDLELEGTYTTDFVVKYNDESIKAWECVLRRHITKPKTLKMLSASREYWLKKGIKWSVVTEAFDNGTL